MHISRHRVSKLKHKFFHTLTRLTTALLMGGCGGGSNDFDDAVCVNFQYQEDAQAAFRGGANQLDGDNDGKACESLASRPYTPLAVLPAPSYNFMNALGEVIALTPAGNGQHAMSVWGALRTGFDPGPIGRSTTGGTTQISGSLVTIRYGSQASDLVPYWSNLSATLQGDGSAGFGFIPASRSLVTMSGAYRAIGQICQQGRAPCTSLAGTIALNSNGTVQVCVAEDLIYATCTLPLVLPITRSASDPEGLFSVGHETARLLSSPSGSLAMSYQDVYASPSNPSPKFSRTTWFAVPSASASLAAIDTNVFEGFASNGAIGYLQASGWSLLDNTPLKGFRSEANGRLVLRGANGHLITWSSEAGLQSFVQR